MGFTINPYKYQEGYWQATFYLADRRVRKKSPFKSRVETKRWAKKILASLQSESKATSLKPKSGSISMKSFAPTFLDGYAKANRHKASGIQAKETILRCHILPVLGKKKLDEIGHLEIQMLKASFKGSPKTLNNVLSVLNVMLKTAHEWGLVTSEPVVAKLVKARPIRTPEFYTNEESEALISGTSGITRALLLLGLDAGLRCGEMMALKKEDLQSGSLHIRHSVWHESTSKEVHLDSTKGGRARRVPMSPRLKDSLDKLVPSRDGYLFPHPNKPGAPRTRRMIRRFIYLAQVFAGMEKTGVHILRHTFCSNLAMSGMPVRVIQALAGHANVTTTERYMHISEGDLDREMAKIWQNTAKTQPKSSQNLQLAYPAIA